MAARKITVHRYHIDLPAKLVTVEFRIANPVTGVDEPPLGFIRQEFPLTAEVTEALNAYALPHLDADLGTLQGVRSSALTSELHRIREAKKEHGRILEETLELEKRSQLAATEALEREADANALRAQIDTMKSSLKHEGRTP